MGRTEHHTFATGVKRKCDRGSFPCTDGVTRQPEALSFLSDTAGSNATRTQLQSAETLAGRNDSLELTQGHSSLNLGNEWNSTRVSAMRCCWVFVHIYAVRFKTSVALWVVRKRTSVWS